MLRLRNVRPPFNAAASVAVAQQILSAQPRIRERSADVFADPPECSQACEKSRARHPHSVYVVAAFRSSDTLEGNHRGLGDTRTV
jgi:hypothetical protein